MSVRTDSATERLRRTSNVPSYDSNYTYLRWIYLVALPSGGGCILSIDDSNDDVDEFYVDSSGVLAIITLSGGSVTQSYGTTTLSTGTWYCVAIVRSANNSRSVYLGSLTSPMAQELTHTTSLSGRTAPNEMSAGSVLDSDLLNGRHGRGRLWTAALTLAELQTEQYSPEAVRLTNLYADWHTYPGTTERLADWSGNGNHWSAVGTLTDEDDPPLIWDAVPAPYHASSSSVSVSSAGGIASAEAFGTPTITVGISPSGITSGEAVGTQAVQAHLTNISGIASVEAVGTPTVGGSITPAGIASSEAFGTPTITVGIASGAIASAEAVGSPTIQAAVAVAGGIASTEAFGAPVMTLAVNPASVGSGEALGSPALSVEVAGVGNIVSAEAFGEPNVSTTSPVNLTDAGNIASAEAFGTPILSVALAPAGIDSGEAFDSLSLTVDIAGAGNVASGEAFGEPNVSTAAPVNLTDVGNIASAEAFGSLVITLAVNPASVGSGEAFGSPALSVNVAGAGNISSAEAFGNPNVSTTAPVNLTDAGNIASVEAFGVPGLALQLESAGIASNELFGAPTIVMQIAPAGIASGEAFGNAIVGDAVIVYEPVLRTRERDQVIGIKTRNLR